jgi:hypothetical protein
MRAIPEPATPDLAASKGFWRAAGLDVTDYDNGFAFAARHGVELHLVLGAEPAAVATSSWRTLTPSIEGGKPEPSASPVHDEPCGMRDRG